MAEDKKKEKKLSIKPQDPPRLNTRNRPIVNQYREGKAKRTPGGE